MIAPTQPSGVEKNQFLEMIVQQCKVDPDYLTKPLIKK